MSIEQGSQTQSSTIPDRRFARLLDELTGAKRLQPLVLDVMGAFNAEGIDELSESQIEAGMGVLYPERSVKISTICRALDGLEASGLVTKRHVFATEAIEKDTYTGPRYKRVESPSDSK